MPQLSQDQAELKAGIEKSAAIWGAILGLIAGGIAYWALGGQSSAVRIGLAVAIGVAVLFGIRTWRIKANSTAATCGKCNATFSITQTDRVEKTLSSEPKETRDAQPDFSTKVTTWTEEKVETTLTYTCAKCDDTTTKVSQRTVKKDEKETIEPAPIKDKPKAKTAPKATSGTKTKPKGKAASTKKSPP